MINQSGGQQAQYDSIDPEAASGSYGYGEQRVGADLFDPHTHTNSHTHPVPERRG
jgi:hypothetical protein